MINAIQALLELAGALLIVAAVALAVWSWSVPAALAVAGVGLLAVSAVVQLRNRRPA